MDWRVRRIIDNLWGPTGTFLIHVLVIIGLMSWVTISRPPRDTGVEAIIVIPTPQVELEKLKEDLQKLEDLPQVVDAVAPPQVNIDAAPPSVDAVSASDSDSVDISDLNMLESASPVVFKGLWSGRSASGRGDSLSKYSGGMGERTEIAVMKALRWLKDHQYPDGSWGPNYRVAMTSLALLSFLAHGETTSSQEFGDAIRRGLRYLLKSQKDGMFRGGGNTQVATYEHAIGTYAISEAYGLTSIPYLRFAMEDAVQVIIDGQHEGGSWDYGYKKGPEAHLDVSLAGWHLQALEAAINAGAENRGLKTTVDTGIRGMTVLSDKSSGLFSYSTRLKNEGPNMPMTGVGVLCMQLTGHAMDSEARAGIKALGNLNFRWTKSDVNLPNQDLRQVSTWPIYAWYYITQAKFQQGGKDWISWNKQFAPTLCNTQNPDGSWCPAPASQEAAYGPVYSTALCTLMLQVYYRILPTYAPIQVEKPSVEDEDPKDEIIIKFG